MKKQAKNQKENQNQKNDSKDKQKRWINDEIGIETDVKTRSFKNKDNNVYKKL